MRVEEDGMLRRIMNTFLCVSGLLDSLTMVESLTPIIKSRREGRWADDRLPNRPRRSARWD